ncbi:MAG: DMT family transporter, partial [Candidatus Cloacimonetes bacterium]|nr:DMT family transporter [Candidatus Cloacimonadota bacterium]
MNLKSHLFCLIAIVIWSSLEITGKLVGTGIDPFTLTAWRFVIGGLALLPIALKQNGANKQKISLSSILYIGSLGILNVCVSMLLLQLSIFFGKASVTAVIVSMNPLVVSVFALLLIKEKLSKPQIFSLGLGAIGLLFIVFFERDFSDAAFLNLPLGILYAIGASISFGLWTVLTKASVQKNGNTITNAISFLFGGIVLLIFNIVVGKPAIFTFTPLNLLFMAYLGLIITGLSYLLYFEGMKKITASKASVYFFLKPALASFLAYTILKE